jgi:hypothetical protein
MIDQGIGNVVGKGDAPLQFMVKVYLRSIWSDVESGEMHQEQTQLDDHCISTQQAVQSTTMFLTI